MIKQHKLEFTVDPEKRAELIASLKALFDNLSDLSHDIVIKDLEAGIVSDQTLFWGHLTFTCEALVNQFPTDHLQ